MEELMSILLTALIGAIGYFLANFFFKYLFEFLQLQEETHIFLIDSFNIHPLEKEEKSEKKILRLNDAIDKSRILSAKLHALNNKMNKLCKCTLCCWQGYKIKEAADAMIDYHVSLLKYLDNENTALKDNEQARACICEALKLKLPWKSRKEILERTKN